jgi:hypothetical protein
MTTLASPAAAPAVTQQDLNDWYDLQSKLAIIKDQEMELRKKIFSAYFPSPTEGVNTAPLSEGWVIKGTHKITRSIDEAMLLAKQDELLKEGIAINDLIRRKPELNLKAYKALPDRASLLFSQVLDIKPGSPSLEIVKPKR